MTPEEYQVISDLIDNNLSGVPKISPAKHREVEHALLDSVRDLSTQSITVLRQGMIHIGDVNGTDVRYVVNIPDVGTANYYLIGSYQPISNNWNNDNDVIWSWGEPTRTSFCLYFREMASRTQNINFWYMLIPIPA